MDGIITFVPSIQPHKIIPMLFCLVNVANYVTKMKELSCSSLLEFSEDDKSMPGRAPCLAGDPMPAGSQIFVLVSITSGGHLSIQILLLHLM